ncbi:MAG: DUF4091 domain-containing protein [Clostridiales bacterium]|nr:DUF4091 domain-containing protein [Clostridiales bacterium]
MPAVNLAIASSLEKIFPNNDIVDSFESFSMLKNEKKAFQLVVWAKKGDVISFETKSDLSEYLNYFYVELIPGGSAEIKNADDYYLQRKNEYPDLLVPLKEKSFAAKTDGYNSIWVQISSDNLPAGKHNIIFSCGGEERCVCVNVIDEFLPKQTLIYTNWFHTDCLMSYYGFETFSDEYWRVTENFLRRAVQYGMNCVLTPLFTPPLDTKIGGERPTVQLVDVEVKGKNKYSFNFEKLDKWIDMCLKCKIEYFEMSHFFTQWGARHAPKITALKNGKEKKIFGWKTVASGRKYRLFTEQFSSAFTEYVNKKGIKDKCFLHVSDEPNGSMAFTYGKAAKIIKDNYNGFKIIDALSSFKIYEKGLIQTPIPAIDHIEPFIGNVPELWAYYCGAQSGNYVSNRYFSMPSARNRILGFQLYKFNVKGFLHWGYNFYYSQFSKGLIDPFKVTDAGGNFPSGDSFIVYPGKEGSPLDSLRLQVFYDALQDLRALYLLESKIGREKTIAILEEGLEKPLTFSEYPHSEKWLLETRERINSAVSEN